LPAGSSSNIPAFLALLGNKVKVTVLVDSGTEGQQRIQAAITAGRLAAEKLVTVGEITGTKNADIEDLFEPTEYLKLYNEALGRNLDVAALPPGDRIIKRIEAVDGKFDHWDPAELLLRDQPNRVPTLSVTALERFERLFKRINSTLSN
ncbi:MAG: AAA family ATPase, partial [Blastocatellia bacterium]